LSAQQLDAWTKCLDANISLEASYSDSAADGAYVQITWRARKEIGPLQNFTVEVANSTSDFKHSDTLSGSAVAFLERSGDKPIRVIARGKTIVGGADFSASITVPSPDKVAPPPSEPARGLVPMDGKAKETITRWGLPNNTRTRSWDCLALDVAGSMVLVEVTPSKNNKPLRDRRRTTCIGHKPKADYCDSKGEDCFDVKITHGCLVTKEWLAWYTERQKARNEPFSRSQVCELPQ